jgi:hypothetical protein
VQSQGDVETGQEAESNRLISKTTPCGSDSENHVGAVAVDFSDEMDGVEDLTPQKAMVPWLATWDEGVVATIPLPLQGPKQHGAWEVYDTSPMHRFLLIMSQGHMHPANT